MFTSLILAVSLTAGAPRYMPVRTYVPMGSVITSAPMIYSSVPGATVSPRIIYSSMPGVTVSPRIIYSSMPGVTTSPRIIYSQAPAISGSLMPGFSPTTVQGHVRHAAPSYIPAQQSFGGFSSFGGCPGGNCGFSSFGGGCPGGNCSRR